MKKMVALQDVGESIKKGDTVDVLEFNASFPKEYLVIEYLDGWYVGQGVFDDTKVAELRFTETSLKMHFRELTHEEMIIGTCSCCGEEIVSGDKFLNYADDEDRENIYCSDCFEGYTVTRYYMVGGEYLGSDDDGWREQND